MTDWIDELVDAEEKKQWTIDAHGQRVLNDALIVDAGIPVFWQKLDTELRSYVDRLQRSPLLRISGSVTDSSEPKFENRLRVDLSLQALRPEIAYTNLFHLIGDYKIRCHTLMGDQFELHFGLHRNDRSVGVYLSDGRAIVMNPAEAARFVVEPMVKQIRSKLS